MAYHGTRGTRVPCLPGTPTSPSRCPSTEHRYGGVRPPTAAREQRSGLREAFSTRMVSRSKRACALALPHLRSISPGTQMTPRVIWGKCWIASRSRLTGAGQAWRAWPGGPGPSQGPRGPWDTVPRPLPDLRNPPETTRKGHFLVTFPDFSDPTPNKTESISVTFPQKTDPAPTKPESGRSGFLKPDLRIHARNPVFLGFLTLSDRTVG